MMIKKMNKLIYEPPEIGNRYPLHCPTRFKLSLHRKCNRKTSHFRFPSKKNPRVKKGLENSLSRLIKQLHNQTGLSRGTHNWREPVNSFGVMKIAELRRDRITRSILSPTAERADYWKSQGRKHCDFCKCWIADNKPSIQFHEGGKKHKENVTKRLKETHKTSAKKAKQTRKFENDLKNMENAAMAAYLKDVEGNTADLTAQQIIRDKRNRTEIPAVPDNPNQMPEASLDTNPRHKRPQGLPADIDYCNPTTFHRARVPQPRIYNPPSANPSENNTQGKVKPTREKRRGKKEPEGEKFPKQLVQKLWYEARSPEGYTYYWHTETNETTWDPPEEGFMTIGEQEEEAKEQALQAELLDQLEEEETKAKADIIEEQRANAERERLKELRKQPRKNEDDGDKSDDVVRSKEQEEIPYRRDYSVPDKVDPYGPWQTVEVIPKKIVNLQLPKKREVFQVPKPQESEAFVPQRTFKEKTVSQVTTGDSDDDNPGVSFKKRKFGNRNVRKRLDDD